MMVKTVKKVVRVKALLPYSEVVVMSRYCTKFPVDIVACWARLFNGSLSISAPLP